MGEARRKKKAKELKMLNKKSMWARVIKAIFTFIIVVTIVPMAFIAAYTVFKER